MSGVQQIRRHTCVACDAQFNYLQTVFVSSSGTVQNPVGQGATHPLPMDVNVHPCPSCGTLQPEMIAAIRVSWPSVGMIVLFAVVCVTLLCPLMHFMRISTSAYVATTSAAIAVLLGLRGVFCNPNRDLHANLAIAQLSIDSGKLSLEKPGVSPVRKLKYTGLRIGHLVGFVFAGLALAAVALPLVLLRINGWHQNDSTYPAVVGAGDTTTFYFDESIKSLRGYWKGKASVQVVNANDLGINKHEFEAKTQQSEWGEYIRYRRRSRAYPSPLWIQVSASRMLDLTGKKVDFEFAVDVQYPRNRQFINERKSFQHRASVVFSTPEAGSVYYSSWGSGQLVSLFLYFVGLLCHYASATSLARKGNPSELINLNTSDHDQQTGTESDGQIVNQHPEKDGFSGQGAEGLEGGLD